MTRDQRPSALATALARSGFSSASKLQAGDRAPAFELPGSDARSHSLSDHLDKRGIVLAWYPKAYTPG